MEILFFVFFLLPVLIVGIAVVLAVFWPWWAVGGSLALALVFSYMAYNSGSDVLAVLPLLYASWVAVAAAFLVALVRTLYRLTKDREEKKNV